MAYHNYNRLSPRDFELLSADIIEAKEGVRVERFAVGPDGGIDLRFFDNGNTAIVQAKRIGVWSQLRSSVKQERGKIEKLNCDRYILVTSCSLTPGNKEQLKELIGPSLKTSGDIITGDEVDALLEKYPEVKKRHLKLWVKDAEELSTVLNKGLYQLNTYYIDELFHHARVFVEHKYVSEVDNFIAKSHCCLITGEPGVGKTALAGYMALIRYVSEEHTQMQAWHAAISSLKNSEDAVSVAEEVTLNQRFRKFITLEKIDLGDLLDDLCYSEVEVLEDEDHIGAVLSDIDALFEGLLNSQINAKQ